MNIPVAWLSYREQTPRRGYWDDEIIEGIFSQRSWRPQSPHKFFHLDEAQPLGGFFNPGVFVLPSRHHAATEYVERLNRDIATLPWLVLMLIGDEESAFPVHLLHHPNMRVWQMMARPDNPHVHTRLPNGPAPHVHLADGPSPPYKAIDYFFAGQVTHERRQQCVEQLRRRPGLLVESSGFTQGLSPAEYITGMLTAKLAPCPSGPQAPDSFRFAEALELGCVPIADAHAPVPYPDGYWQSVFGGGLPFPIIEQWSDLPTVMERELAAWPTNANWCSAFWIAYKRHLAYQLQRDISELSGQSPQPSSLDDQITVIMPVSPWPSHPDTTILDQSIASVRHHFPEAEIRLLCDGVRPEYEPRRGQYQEFLRRVLWKCQRDKSYWNVLPTLFDTHRHQAAMVKDALCSISTPLLFWIESDMTLTTETDRPIDWPMIADNILSGRFDVVRLMLTEDVHPLHEYLYQPMPADVPIRPQRQWSGWAHLASTEMYRRMLAGFDMRAKMTIERYVTAIIEAAPWERFKQASYLPEPGRSKRISHLDCRLHPGGQQKDPSYEELEVYPPR